MKSPNQTISIMEKFKYLIHTTKLKYGILYKDSQFFSQKNKDTAIKFLVFSNNVHLPISVLWAIDLCHVVG